MDQNLLEKFFNHECSAEEQRKVLAWYLSGEADQELSEKIKAYWNGEKHQINDQWSKEELFTAIEEQIDASQQKHKPTHKKRGSASGQFLKSWKYAAVITLLLISAAAWYQLKDSFLTSEQLTKEQSREEEYIIKQTAKGEKLTFTLKDSTVIQLNSESTLKYKPSSGREVFLEGEAFFDVARDTLRPFRIYTRSITTTVLGTSFNIKAFTNEDDIAVSVVSGKVKVEQQDTTQKKTLHLAPGEQALYTHQDTAFTKKKFEYQEVISWKDGRLYFKNARFAEVITTLERWYGVEIEVQRKGIENGFSGSYTNRSLESVLEGMSFVLEFEYEINNNQITIK
ncbi:FecR domain-containing protein [Catalinimonas sp. 4WD22]|uniref:FecR family protein n=1 Tax=Catalinimonas locisalis TaxID=3133978 RepID=UPI003100CFDC